MRRYLAIIGVLAGCLLVSGLVSRSDALPLKPGDILVAEPSGIESLDPVTGIHTLFSSVVADDIDSWGRDIFAFSNHTIVQIDPNTGAGKTISTGGFLNNAFRVAVGPASAVYTLSSAGLVKIDVRSGAQTVVSGGVFGEDLSVRPDGKIVVINAGDHNYLVDPDTGTFTMFSVFQDHLKLGDISTDGLLAVVDPDIELFAAGTFFKPPANPDPTDFGDEGMTDITWGLYDNLFFATSVGVFHVNRPADSPLNAPLSYSAITHDVHGRITAFVPAPPTLLLVFIGLIGLASSHGWQERGTR